MPLAFVSCAISELNSTMWIWKLKSAPTCHDAIANSPAALIPALPQLQPCPPTPANSRALLPPPSSCVPPSPAATSLLPSDLGGAQRGPARPAALLAPRQLPRQGTHPLPKESPPRKAAGPPRLAQHLPCPALPRRVTCTLLLPWLSLCAPATSSLLAGGDRPAFGTVPATAGTHRPQDKGPVVPRTEVAELPLWQQDLHPPRASPVRADSPAVTSLGPRAPAGQGLTAGKPPGTTGEGRGVRAGACMCARQ